MVRVVCCRMQSFEWSALCLCWLSFRQGGVDRAGQIKSLPGPPDIPALRLSSCLEQLCVRATCLVWVSVVLSVLSQRFCLNIQTRGLCATFCMVHTLHAMCHGKATSCFEAPVVTVVREHVASRQASLPRVQLGHLGFGLCATVLLMLLVMLLDDGA